MSILRSAFEIASAATSDLVETYNAMTGHAIKKFENRATAERRTEMALLAAADRAGHAGVPRNSNPTPKTMQELPEEPAPGHARRDADLHAASNARIAAMLASEKPAPSEYPAGSLRAKLAAEIAGQSPVAPRLKVADLAASGVAAAPRQVVSAVRATFAGTSRCQPNSIRASVLAAIQAAPAHTMTVAALDAHFGHSTRGYVQKLLEKEHLTIVEGAV